MRFALFPLLLLGVLACSSEDDASPGASGAGGMSGSSGQSGNAGEGGAGAAGAGAAGVGGAGSGGAGAAGMGASTGGSGGSGGAAGAGGGTVGGASGGGQAGAAGTAGAGGDAGTGGAAGAGASGISGQGGAAGSGNGGAGNGPAEDAPTEAVKFSDDGGVFPNPERGFYSAAELLEESSLGWIPERGHTLVHSYVRLDEWRNKSLPPSLLSTLDSKMGMVRAAGLKLVLRFSYNFGPYPDSEPDAPKSRILEHIAQLTPFLKKNADAIAVVQAGFIGAWGEWHTSTNDLLDDPADRKDILEALLGAVPPERSVVIRYPAYKKEMYGGPLDLTTAWTGSFTARTGHHNDCFLSSSTDVGTYPQGQQETWKKYLEQDNLYVPMGGETCAVYEASTACAPALAEMKRLRFTFLNQDYQEDVVQGWVDGGCKAEMDRKLGYRLTLIDAELPPQLRPGGSFLLRVRLKNDGWAAPINPRPARLVLRQGATVASVELPGSDARRWLPGQTATLEARVRIPASWPQGPSTLALALPDPSALGGDPRYAIRIASAGVWEQSTGENRLGDTEIQADAPGTADSAAQQLQILP